MSATEYDPEAFWEGQLPDKLPELYIAPSASRIPLPPMKECKACSLTFQPPLPHSKQGAVTQYCDDCRPFHVKSNPDGKAPLRPERIEEAFTQLTHYRMAIEEVRKGLATMRLTRLQALDILNRVIEDHG